MKYRYAVLNLFFVAILAMPVFAQEKTAPATPQRTVEDPPPVLAVPPGYRYDARGRRDPFVNPIPKPAPPAAPEVRLVRPSGIKGALLEEVNVVGVFVARDDASMTRAILSIPGMKAPVMASRGDALFDAVIKEIRPDGVVFTMSGNREVLKKLRSTAGDKK